MSKQAEQGPYRGNTPVYHARLAAFLMVALIAVRADSALAQSPGVLFVLMTSESAFDQRSVEEQLDVPIYWIETDRLESTTADIKKDLSDIEGMTEQEVLALVPEIEARTQKLIAPRKETIKRAYRDAAAAGEISVRFGVTTLPAIVEVSDGGYFRRIEGITNVVRAIQELENRPYRHESDGLPRGAVNSGGLRKVRLGDDSFPVARAMPSPQDTDTRADSRSDAAERRAIREAVCDTFAPSSLINFGDGILRLAEPGGGYCGTGAAQESKYSMVNALIDASLPVSFDCMDLTVTGVCLYLTTRVYCTPLGCSVDVTPEASVELTHFNPDVLVGISKRLGASPIAESELLFGALQNTISKPFMEAVTRRPVPPGYSNPELWAGAGSEAQTEGVKSTMKYHEVEVVGHPGSVFQYINDSGGNIINGLKDRVAEIPQNIKDGAQDSVDQVAGSETTNNMNDVFGHADIISELPGWEAHPPESLIFIAEHIFPTGILDAVTAATGIAGDISALYTNWDSLVSTDISDLGTAVTGAVDDLVPDSFDSLSPEDFVEAMEEFVPGEFTEAVTIFRDVQNIQESLGDIPGLGSSDIDLFSICPTDTDIMKPYFLSGFDIPQWRFNIPEIVYPETYAFPLPGSDLYVGLVDGMTGTEVEDPEGERFPLSPVIRTFTSLFGAWGSVYPRQGYSTQADEMKAASVAGFRAAHVVTRPSQKHIYNYLKPKEDPKYLKVKHPDPLSPIDEATGKWQLVAPELSDHCVVFGQDDGLIDPWTRDKQSDDRMYGYTLWRQYQCCPTPKKAGATVMVVTDLGTIPLDIELM